MRVAMLSKACVVGIYQRKLEEIASLGVDLLALVPPSWRDERGDMPLERVYTSGYRLETVPIHLNGDFHLHYYGEIGRKLRAFQPDVVHIDEEPYNLAAWQALFHAERLGAKNVFFSWQNIKRDYPPPFSWGERWALNRASALIAGTDSAADVWREKGYTGTIRVIPQFGIDPDLFKPTVEYGTLTDEVPPLSLRERGQGGEGVFDRPFTIGYFGRLVPEKGIDTLLNAVSRLTGEWRLILLGGGPQRDELAALAASLGIEDRVEFHAQVRSTDMPAQYHDLDVFVLPSLTRHNWKEQFGRVLVEAMASGVPVVGSDSGAIPGVIGDAGLIFPEGSADSLASHLASLQTNSALHADLSRRGRERALAHFTHAQVAATTVALYQALKA